VPLNRLYVIPPVGFELIPLTAIDATNPIAAIPITSRKPNKVCPAETSFIFLRFDVSNKEKEEKIEPRKSEFPMKGIFTITRITPLPHTHDTSLVKAVIACSYRLSPGQGVTCFLRL
jgi:hypothetical protein